jgi:pimeloyl-ACP methyl ester carboxylesterase
MLKMKDKRLESKRITVNGQTIHYKASIDADTSNKPVILFIHGLVVSCRYLLPTARELSHDYVVYVPDFPGYGWSSKPRHGQALNIKELADVLAAWMDVMGIQQASLLGNSMGCQIIAQFALHYPERLERAILVGPTMDQKARTAYQEIGRWLLNAPFEPISLFPVVLLDYLQIGFRRFVRTFRYALQDRIEEHLPHILVPTLVVRGSRDTVVPQRWVEEVTALLPRGKLVVIEGAAHDVNYNSPRQLAEAVHQFMQEEETEAVLS